MKRLAAVSLLALAASASAFTPGAVGQEPDPEEFTPYGYEFCGWKDYEYGGWVMEWEDRLVGASTVLFARKMTCRSARRNHRRLRYSRRPPYRPFRAGYRCQELESGWEFSDVRCKKRGKPRVAFRYQTGA